MLMNETAQGLAKLFLVGHMRIVDPDGEEIVLRNRKTRAIVAIIALAEGKRVSRNRLASLLWDRADLAQARMSLRHALSELNRFVNAKVASLIQIERELVCLDVERCWIDIFAPSAHYERLLEDLDGISTSLDEWLASERARFEYRERSSLERELQKLIEENAAPELKAAAARKLINFDPTHEGAVRVLMAAFAEMGDRAQATREYERCREALRSKLDLPPSADTTAAYEAIRDINVSEKTAGSRQRESASQAGTPKTEFHSAAATEFVDHASIAVLPFRNLSGEEVDGHINDGLVEDLIQILSRVPNFFVISRLSSLAFRGQDRLPQEIGAALGVKYIISGSMRVVGHRLRLTVELTDTRTGAVLWNSRLDETFFDLLEVQERLAYAIVRRVGPHVHAAELKRTRAKRLDDLGAYELFLQAQETMHNSSRSVFESAERLFDQVIARDLGYATALAWRAYWHVLRVGQGWSPDPAHDTAEAEQFAKRAIECDSGEPMAFAISGHIASYLHKDFDLASQYFATALDLNPNSAHAWLWSAAAAAWAGDGPRAIEEINKAIALSPYDPLMYAYSSIAAMAYLADGQYDRAIECALRSLRENNTYTSALRQLVMASQLAGKTEQARRAVHQLLRLEPDLTVEKFRRRYPGSATRYADLYCDALARAGVPVASSKLNFAEKGAA